MASIRQVPWGLLLVNSLTFSRMVAGVLAILISSSESLRIYLALPFSYILVSDLLDGALARRLAVETRAGGIFDYVVDRFNFYLVIIMLVHNGVPFLVLLPYLVRDLIYVSVQAYINLPTISGTKAASFGGTLGTYSYALAINYWGIRIAILEVVLFLALLFSLFNLLARIYRHKDLLREELRKDIFS